MRHESCGYLVFPARSWRHCYRFYPVSLLLEESGLGTHRQDGCAFHGAVGPRPYQILVDTHFGSVAPRGRFHGFAFYPCRPHPSTREIDDRGCPQIMKITAIILTFNEEQHLARCIASLQGIATEIVVVDCYSTDSTLDIARSYRARVIQHKWANYATQFNWALTQLDAETDWVLRIDADEVLTPELVAEIRERLPNIGPKIDGVYWGRRMTFQGRLIRYGGVFPVRVLRLFCYGRGQCENRWMDEHIKVSGPTVNFVGEMIDDNLNSLTWWTDKHNKYASREAVDLLNLEYGFMPHDSVASLRTGSQAAVKRWIKESVYARLPGGFRAFAYFFYRYVVRLGFLDGQAGTTFHFLQGFWYRYLVDAKVTEVRRFMQEKGVPVERAIEVVLGIKLSERERVTRTARAED